ncbi:MAG: GIY-YIG nuclease family protein [Deltaproteobacteria bacterium]|nr:GIY-YIG nuclease family protein [Deltaproteobacteria bacterium]MBI3018233.1 GIY-YIG nuclease family protein [Deltaproteobacteria bacterium]
MKQYFVYIMTNQRNTVIYTGITSNIEKRVYEHKMKMIPGFTQKYNVDKLVYYEEFPDPEAAISAEKKIKGWTRKKKINLIESLNLNWNDLSFNDDQQK